MEKIPTAENFLEQKFPEFEDLDNGNVWVNIEETMIEFAKLHVEAALKLASGKAEIEEIWDNPVNPSMGTTYGVDKDSILNSYPLENIK